MRETRGRVRLRPTAEWFGRAESIISKKTRLTKRAPHRAVPLERPGQFYSAKLLFQYRIVVGGKSDVRRVCEERVVLLRVRSEREALARCVRWGKGEHHTELRPGRRINYEFLGVTGLNTSFFSEVEDPTEVWYEFSIKPRPSERRHKLIPPLRGLDAFAEPGAASGNVSMGRLGHWFPRK